jgi:LacI family transcriptional regulator
MKPHSNPERREFPKPILISPPGMVPRRSAEVSSVYDRQLAAGVRFMREHALENITVNDVVRAAGISRRVFERRFAKLNLVGRSPKAEMLRLRLERAKELLMETNWTLAQIAEKTGFKYAEYLHVMFTQKTGVTPGKFRQMAKGKPDRWNAPNK